LLLRALGYGEGASGDPGDDWVAVMTALRRSGLALEHRLLADPRGDVMAARSILLERLGRMAGGQ
jgi:DNA repair protein RecO (recombination protein O)